MPPANAGAWRALHDPVDDTLPGQDRRVGERRLNLAHAAVVVWVRMGDEDGFELFAASFDPLGEFTRLVEDELNIDQNRVLLPLMNAQLGDSAAAEPAKTSN